MGALEESESPCGADQQPEATAVVYHYFAHYRLPVLRRLAAMWGRDSGGFVLLADIESNVPSIKLISENEWDCLFRDFGAQRIRVRNRWMAGNFLWQGGVVPFAARCSQKNIIFLGSPYFLSTWVGTLVARLRGRRVLYWTHGVTRRDGPAMRFLKKVFYSLPNGLLLYGNYAKDRLAKEYGIDARRMQVIYNSLDHEAHRALRTRFTEDDYLRIRANLFAGQEDRPLLVAVGRLTARKKLDQLVRACSLLRDRGTLVNLLFIGDGAMEEPLRDLVKDLDLEGATVFFGSCYEEETLAGLVGGADLCVIPGALGLSAMHSLAFGTPVVTHDRPDLHGPEFEAVIPGYTGDFFRMDDVECLAATIASSLANGSDRESRRRACHHIMDTYYNPDTQARLIAAILRGEEVVDEIVERPQ